MTTALYVSLSALLIFWLSMNVIKLRRKHRISIGDGGNDELRVAMATQSNAIEYIPIALLLLFALEYNHAEMWLIHFLGTAFILGRIIHARNLLLQNLKGRVLGMQITLYSLIAMAIVNLAYIPYNKFMEIYIWQV